MTISYARTTYIINGTGKEGTVSTASRNCRFHRQRLQGLDIASNPFGSLDDTPRALRPARLQWLNMLVSGMRKCIVFRAKTAAFSGSALSLTTILNSTSICGLEAGAGASPPSSVLQFSRGPPKKLQLSRKPHACALAKRASARLDFQFTAAHRAAPAGYRRLQIYPHSRPVWRGSCRLRSWCG